MNLHRLLQQRAAAIDTEAARFRREMEPLFATEPSSAGAPRARLA